MSQLLAWRGGARRPFLRRLLVLTSLVAVGGGALASAALAAALAGRGAMASRGTPGVRYGTATPSSHPSGGSGSGPPPGGGKSGSGGKASYGSGSAKAGALGQKSMWIWYVADSNGGDVRSIIATARHYDIGTLIIKSGDGTSYWSQFSKSLVKALHAAGLRVCGWQYVYGTQPGQEAKVGAQAAQAGADCLLIDAESEYEGKYVQAQKYIRVLRSRVGSGFRLGLASFPYVDFHPALPYSVFLGPGGAQFDVPQMYWQDIGDSPGTVYAHTYSMNTPYKRAIVPLGQTYNSPPAGQIKRFRQLRWVYRAPGISWYDWQSASSQAWQALRAPIKKLDTSPQTQMPTLAQSGQSGIAAGDLVVWAQEHLISAGYHVAVDGDYGSKTATAVTKFQTAHHLSVTGEIDPTTWAVLLRYPPARVTWTAGGATVTRLGGLALPPPASARLPAVAYEIPPHLGAGHPGAVNP
jgi:hypothetical protein